MKKLNIYLLSFIFIFAIYGNFSFADIKCDLDKLKPLRFGEKNIYVRNFQVCLQKAGYKFPKGITGVYDEQTVEIVKKFYQNWYGDHNGKYFGKLGINHLKKLIAELKESKITIESIKKFSSKKELLDFLKKVKKKYPIDSYTYIINGRERAETISTLPFLQESQSLAPDSRSDRLTRFSETTVQVKGIDEADIVKTDGENIYYSIKYPYYYDPFVDQSISDNSITSDELTMNIKPSTKIIKSFPVNELKEESKIEDGGDLYLIKPKNILVILGSNVVKGYDISNIQKPEKRWEIKLSGHLFTSRFYKDKIYLITKQNLDYENPCPIVPLSLNNNKIEISCNDIYQPPIVLPIENIVSVFMVEPENGEVIQKTSLLENSSWYGRKVVYMSYNHLYITYPNEIKESEVLINAILEKLKDILPQDIINKVSLLKDLDLYESSKINELQMIFQYYLRTIKKETREEINKKLSEKLFDYYKEKMRDYDKSVVLKIDLDDLNVKAVGEVPGIILNQFSLDEYNNNLRIGVTVGERNPLDRIIYMIRFTGREFISENDVYILDENLTIVGSVKNLGKGERIYAVRFIEDKGYVVTFREIDPFYVIDLSDQYNPKLSGELKIPGYSSYLHPINKDKILGIGKEGQKVKISLFNVSNPKNPIEKSKYILDEYWTEVLSNFRSFLLDDQYQIFFIPASRGYIFSYKDDNLTLKKEISAFKPPERAVYINNYLYLISKSEIIVFDLNNFEKVNELKF